MSPLRNRREAMVLKREALGLSQEQLADRAGVSRSAVYDAERGQDIRVGTAKRLASVLQIDWTYFFADDASISQQAREKQHGQSV